MIRIGLIGDYNSEVAAHRAIPKAIILAAQSAKCGEIETVWLATKTLQHGIDKPLSSFDGLWCVPGSPYASTAGALNAIRFARKNGVPFLGTCGGFQHALIEYARDVLGLADAEHAETSPSAAFPLISRLACSLVEKEGKIFLQENSRIRRIYGKPEATETYHCNFGLNPAHETRLNDGCLKFTGRDESGEIRVLELDRHPFFIATLFQPERPALRGEVHPLIGAYVRAVLQTAGTPVMHPGLLPRTQTL